MNCKRKNKLQNLSKTQQGQERRSYRQTDTAQKIFPISDRALKIQKGKEHNSAVVGKIRQNMSLLFEGQYKNISSLRGKSNTVQRHCSAVITLAFFSLILVLYHFTTDFRIQLSMSFYCFHHLRVIILPLRYFFSLILTRK